MKRHLRSCLAVVSVFACASPAALCQNTSYDRNVIAEYDMRDYGEFWSLPLTLYGDTHRFGIDTGTGACVFDKSLRYLLGRPLKQKTRNASVADKMFQLYAVPDARVGSLPLERRTYVACADLATIKEDAGGGIAGVLGCEFLRNHIVQFDFESAYLRFLAAVPKSAGQKFPFARDDIRPHCRCRFGAGTEGSFMLGSGSLGIWSVSLRDDLFQRLAAGPSVAPGLAAVPSLVVTGTTRFYDALGQVRQTDRGILKRLDLGELSFEYVRVRKTSFCQLGLRFLSRFIVTIDFPQRVIYLKSINGSHCDDTDAGLVVVRNGRRTIISQVDPLGRAGGLSLVIGDELIRLNGVKAESMNLFELRRTVGREGRDPTLDVKHADGTEATVRLPLHN